MNDEMSGVTESLTTSSSFYVEQDGEVTFCGEFSPEDMKRITEKARLKQPMTRGDAEAILAKLDQLMNLLAHSRAGLA